jgi:hypothetical protein
MKPLSKPQIIAISVSVVIIILAITIGLAVGLTQNQKKHPNTASLSTDNESKSLALEINVPEGLITYPCLNGRFGNQIFEIVATLGLARKSNRVAKFPKWEYSDLFEYDPNFMPLITKEEMELKNDVLQEEECYDFIEHKFGHLSHQTFPLLKVEGFRQHFKYFNFIAYDVRSFLTFKGIHKLYVQERLAIVSKSNTRIGLHIRRGDYVNNPGYDICTVSYYLKAVDYFRQQDPSADVIIITDDKSWCLENLIPRIPNSSISPFQSEKYDFIALSLCDYKIISNSTFGWWAAWLDARFTSQVIAPRPWIRQHNSTYEQMYQSNWIVFDVIHECFVFPQENSKFIEIGGYYQCYKQPRAFVHACSSFRRVYPNSSLIIVSDDGDDFSKAATYFHASKYKRNQKRSGNGSSTYMKSMDQILVFLTNFIEGAKDMKEKYFVLVEDDIAIIRAINIPPTCEIDLIGNNGPYGRLPPAISAYFNQKHLGYGGCGGSLFKSSFWSKLDLKVVKEQLIRFSTLLTTEFPTDMVLTFICLANGGTICAGQELFKTEFVEGVDYGRDKSPAVYHGYKDLYNKPLTPFEMDILRNFGK